MARARVILRWVTLRWVAAGCVAVLAAGCATVPTAGLPEPVTGPSGQARPYVQLVPPKPNASWLPSDIVSGFLAASASFTNKHAAARRFLAPQLRKSWKPSWAVTVVAGGSTVQASHIGPTSIEGESNTFETVKVTGEQLATISNVGQYLDNPGSRVYKFRLARFGNQWLISKLPTPSSLLLNQTDFEEVYQPRNLYFWAPQGSAMVPEPVFAPLQDTYADVATNLVDALLLSNQDQKSWLASATTTAFPRGTSRAGPVQIIGPSAVVNLRGAAASASAGQLHNMAAQLVTTLTSTSYGQPPLSRSVVLKVNGKVREIDGQQTQLPEKYDELVPGSRASSPPLYYLTTDGAVGELSGDPLSRVAVRGPAGRGSIPFAAIAVSSGAVSSGAVSSGAVSSGGQPQLAATSASGKGCVIYSGPLGSTAPLTRRRLPDPGGGACTSLSWDSRGDIWAVSGQTIWVLPPDGGSPESLTPPVLPGSHPSAYRVRSLQVASDGVRVAMLIQERDGTHQVVLAGISVSGTAVNLGQPTTVGASLPDPTALSWYDPDHLILLDRSQLYEVPANGGAAVPVGAVPAGTESVTAAGPGQIATTGNSQILMSTGPDQSQKFVAKGSGATYPG
jgi:hypothetical protein